MSNRFRPILEKLKTATERVMDASGSLVATNQALGEVVEAIGEAVTATIDAKGEHEDLGVTVHRLEELVMELAHEVQQLRRQPPPEGAKA